MKNYDLLNISLVICTYNRAEILKITLPFLLKLKQPEKTKMEIIIIDNNSSDDTKSFVTQFIQENNSLTEIKYFFEGKQGVSHARNTGYEYAKGDYVCYLDDECILPEEWLNVAVNTIRDSNPAILGGPYYGRFLPGVTSSWCKESFGDSYILKHDLPNGPLHNKNVSEGNMIIRKDIFKKIGSFDVEYGMTGSKIAYGEGDEFQRRLREALTDEVVWYNPELFVWHLIRNEKISIFYLFREALIRGQSIAGFSQVKSLKSIIRSPILLLKNIFMAFFSALKKLFQSFKTEEHYLSILHKDYEDGTWRNIGIEWFRTKKLIRMILSTNSFGRGLINMVKK